MKISPKTFIIFFGLFYLAWLLRATVFYSAVDLAIPAATTRLFFSNFVKFMLWVVPAGLYVLYVERQNPLKTMKIITPIDWRGLISGLVVSTLYFALIFGSEKFISGRTLAPLLKASAGAWLVTLAQSFFSPISEELLFRGFVLPQINARVSFWKANIIQALLFTAMHWPNWLWVNGFQPWVVTSSISIFGLGLLFGWLLRRTNSIWPPVAAHILNNFLIAFLG
jgi:uncharacterized protein